jgi:hypothetical protein
VAVRQTQWRYAYLATKRIKSADKRTQYKNLLLSILILNIITIVVNKLLQESINSRTTNQKSDFSKNSDLLAQSRSDVPKSVVLTGGMKILALLHYPENGNAPDALNPAFSKIDSIRRQGSSREKFVATTNR